MIKKLFLGVVIFFNVSYGVSFGTIATGGVEGTYIQIGKDISTLFQKYDVDLQVVATRGSVENIDRILGKEKEDLVSWALVQNDALLYYRFLHFQNSKIDLQEQIKSVFPLYNEDIHIFTRKGKKIDFQKKKTLKVGVKSDQSGSYITAKILENTYGMKFEFQYINFNEAQDFLQKGIIDIFIDVIAKPNDNYQDLQDIDFIELPKNGMLEKTYIETVFTKKTILGLRKISLDMRCLV